jgi:hypothetical protein
MSMILRVASSITYTEFAALVQSLLKIGNRQFTFKFNPSGQVFAAYVNLPKGVGGAAGGAEAENNTMRFSVSGFSKHPDAPSVTGKIKVELRTSALPNEYRMRAKSGTPEQVAKHLADFLNKVAKEVPPNYTHSKVEETIPGTRDIAQRLVNGENDFLEVLMERGGISREDAIKVLDHYRRVKVVKREGLGGRITVKHGEFLDKEVILRALDVANGKA